MAIAWIASLSSQRQFYSYSIFMSDIIKVQRALISVSDKTGIVEFARELSSLGVEIISTGGTAKTLAEAGVPVKEISQFTGFPEMMEGRLKTLHPLVHGGILGKRDAHAAEAQAHNIQWIDLVVVNLYPFSQTIQKPGVTLPEAIEQIDIGGPTMIRAAAKNNDWVAVVVDPKDYSMILEKIKSGGVDSSTRMVLATKAFSHTAQYDSIISNYLLHRDQADPTTIFPETLTLSYSKAFDVRYGENPHQLGAVYKEPNNTQLNILNAKILQGKQLSYNNMNDADGALAAVREFSDPACVVIKHANPCGAATDSDISVAFERAYNADAMSAFGGIIALNRPCNKMIAEKIASVFAEIVLAPTFDSEALEFLAKKPNLRVLELGAITPLVSHQEFRYVDGGLLLQQADTHVLKPEDLKVVTSLAPTPEQIQELLFAWKVLKHMKSNGILITADHCTVGVGAGQVSRVDAVEMAIKKGGLKTTNAVLASDAFFPFRDSIERIAPAGIKAIIQPGGSVKDTEVIAACNELGIAMVFTGIRCFKH